MDKKKVVLIASGVIVSLTVIGVIVFCILFLKNTNQANSEIDSLNGQQENEDAILIDLSKNEEQPIMEEEELTEEEKEQEKNNKYFIRVNYEANVVNIYTQDEDGNFTKPYKAMVCSTGSATPDGGTYKTSDKGKWGYMVGNVWAQYYTRICGSILFHSVPYTAKNNHSLEYWEYDKLGTTASAGCVRLTTKDAKWIYDNCSTGTEVEFYADKNPGPFGKPTAKKISEEEEVRDWDPTDPDQANPWKDYVPEIKDDKETNKTKTGNTTNKTNTANKNATNTTNATNATNKTNNTNTTKTVNNTVSKNTVSTQNKTNSNTQTNTTKTTNTTNTSQGSNATKTTNTTQGTNNTNTTVSNKTNTTNTSTTSNKTETKNEAKPPEVENKTEQTPPEPEKKEPEKLPEQPSQQPSNTTTPPTEPEEPTTDE